MKTTVALAHCRTYEDRDCEAAVGKALGELGGIGAFVKAGQRVFVKPNLLLAADPRRAITTHPAVMKAVIRQIQGVGGEVFFGDLPGGYHAGNVRLIADKCGMTRLAEETGAELVRLEQHGFRKATVADGKRLREFFVPKFIDTVDVLVNVPKLKTHMQSRYTGAIKNLFGFIPTADRLAAHRDKDCAKFSETLVDIFSLFKPQLHVMDAVVGMEGTGPSQGSPVKLGFVLASADAVATDATACRAVGFDPATIPAIVAGARRGFGVMKAEEIRVAGDSLASVRKKIKPPMNAVSVTLPFVEDFLNKAMEVRPTIERKKCKACRMCVEVCPADAIRKSGKVYEIVKEKCIRCFCCHEVCPHGAVAIDKTLLIRIFEIVMAKRR